jgi:TonB family protein
MHANKTAATALAAALLATANLAAASQPSRWAKQPSPAQYRQMRPEAARQGGRAVVRCHVDAAGLLSDCATLTETPPASGYGQALISLAPLFQLKPEFIKAEAPDGQVTLVDGGSEEDKPAAWLHKPSEEDLLVVWPKAALNRDIGGKATINCEVSIRGALFDCVVLSEAPAGENFGAAAIALTPQFLMKPATFKGQPVVSLVNIPISFVVPSGGGGSGGGISRKTVQAAQAWLEAPSFADMAAAYPKRARQARVAGHATLACAFKSTGRLYDCETIAEEPRGQGFGEAARILAGKFRASPTTNDGAPLAGAGVQLPFDFDPAVLTDQAPAIGKPQWSGLPSAEDTQAAFAAVMKAGVGTVRVMLSCTVQPGGAVTDCGVTREEPAGQGVGQAALALTPHFRLSTWTMEGLPTVGGRVNIPLRFEGDAPAPAAKP